MQLSTLIVPVLAALRLRVVAAGDVPDANTYVRVRYADDTIRYFDFGECYPFEINGAIALEAVWSQSTTCYAHQTPQCQGDALPVGVPVPAGTILVNAADFAQIIGQSATCVKNGIPIRAV